MSVFVGHEPKPGSQYPGTLSVEQHAREEVSDCPVKQGLSRVREVDPIVRDFPNTSLRFSPHYYLVGI